LGHEAQKGYPSVKVELFPTLRQAQANTQVPRFARDDRVFDGRTVAIYAFAQVWFYCSTAGDYGCGLAEGLTAGAVLGEPKYASLNSGFADSLMDRMASSYLL